MAASDAKPVPIKNTAYRVTFPIYDADGDLVTGATGLDSEVSKDAGTFADCTNEATEIATSSGIYYLDLTSTEMNADCVAVIVKTSSTGAKTTTLVLYPQESGDIKVDVQSFGGTAGTFASGRPEVNTTHIAGSAVSTSTAQIGVNVVNAGATAWGSGAITAASIASGAITSAKFAASAIDATAIASSAITSAKIASGALTNAAFAADTGMATIRSNTAQAGAASSITLDASASATNDLYKGLLVYITGGTGAGQVRTITAYVGSTKVATVDAAWATNPASGSTFALLPGPGTTIANVEADTQDIQGRLPAALVSGRIDASVGAMASGTLTATAIASDAITAAKVASDVTTEIAAGVLSAATSAPIAADLKQIKTVPLTGTGPFGI